MQYRPGVRGDTLALVFFAGPSGSGKSLSALKFARGLAGGDDNLIAAIDTETGRLQHYFPTEDEVADATHFQPQYLELEPPYTPARYKEAIELAMKLRPKPKVILIDSGSHENDAVNEHHDRVLTKMAGNDYAKRDKMKFAAWIEPKAEHALFLNCVLRQRVHFVITLRAKDAIKPVKNSQGKIEFLPQGWTPISVSGFEYEATALLIFPPGSKGVPDLNAERTKMQGQHVDIFPAGIAITEEAGRKMARWCAGNAKRGAASQPAKSNVAEKPAEPTPVEKPEPKSAEPESAEEAAQRRRIEIAAAAETVTPPAEPIAPSNHDGNRGVAEDTSPTGSTPMEQTKASGVHEDMQALYNNLYQGLMKSRDPRGWWKQYTRSLQMLEEKAPGLYADLVKLGQTRQHKREAVR